MAGLTNDARHTADFFRWDGMNRFLHPFQAPFSELTWMLNYTSDTRFAKTRRSGYTQWLDTPSAEPVLAVIPVTRSWGGAYVLRVTATKVYTYTIGSGATSWGTVSYTWPNPITQVDWAYFAGGLFLCTDTNNLTYMASGVFTALTPTGVLQKNPRYCAVYQGRLYLANFLDNATGNVLYSYVAASRVDDGTSWANDPDDASSAQSFEVDIDHYGAIHKLAVANNRLTIWKSGLTGSMAKYRWDGDVLVQVPTEVSIRPEGADTFGMIDGALYFTNNDGIFEDNGDRPRLKSLALGDLSSQLTPEAAGVINRKYLCSLATDLTVDGRTIANPIVVSDQVANEIYLWNTAHHMTAFATFALSSSAGPRLYSADSNGNTYVWDGATTDNGTPIQGELETRFFFGQRYANDMNFRKVWAYTDVGTQQIAVKNVEQHQWGLPTDCRGPMTELLLPEAQRTKGLAFRITCSDTGANPVFYGFSMDYEELEVR